MWNVFRILNKFLDDLVILFLGVCLNDFILFILGRNICVVVFTFFFL